MTRDDVIRLAREAGVLAGYEGEPHYLERFAALVIKEHSQQVINDPAEIRRVFELDDAEYPPPDSGFMKL